MPDITLTITPEEGAILAAMLESAITDVAVHREKAHERQFPTREAWDRHEMRFRRLYQKLWEQMIQAKVRQV